MIDIYAHTYRKISGTRKETMGKIVSVQTQRFNLPLAEVLSDAKHGDHTHFELITATISLDDGTIGTGYTYTGGRGGHAILAMIDHDLIPQIVGRDASNVVPKLLGNISGYLDAGYNGVKIKIGREDLAEDIARIKAVRELIGPDVAFMVDANYGMDVEKAGTGALKYLQPDVATCGGITTWLRAAELAESQNISVCSHGMQELHVSLLSGRRDSGWLEVHSFPIDTYTKRPLVVENHLAIAPDTPGVGVEFDWEKLKTAHDG